MQTSSTSIFSIMSKSPLVAAGIVKVLAVSRSAKVLADTEFAKDSEPRGLQGIQIHEL